MIRRHAEAIAAVLAEHGFTEADAIRHHDINAAADIAGVDRPTTRGHRFAVIEAYSRLVAPLGA